MIRRKYAQHYISQLPVLFRSYYGKPEATGICRQALLCRNIYHPRCLSTTGTHVGDTSPLQPLQSLNLSELQQRCSEAPQLPEIHQNHRRRLDVAIVGLPNAGKSQLLNILTGASVSAVSRKRHTTRQGLLGARTVSKDNDGDKGTTTTQLLFVDTPGYVHTGPSPFPSSTGKKVKNIEKLDRDLMVSTARREMVAVDYTVIVIDAARRFTPEVRAAIVELIMLAIASQGRFEDVDDDEEDVGDDSSKEEDPSRGDDTDDTESEHADVILPHQKFAVVLNKVDLVHPKKALLDLAFEIGEVAQECLQYRPNVTDPKLPGESQPLDESILMELMPTFFYTSALKDEGVDDLFNFLLLKATPAKVFEVEPGLSSNMQPEERAEEIIREKLYRCLHKELPYQIRQQNRIFKVIKDDTGKLGLLIEQELIVQTKSHQELIRGRGNQTLERIRESAEFAMKNAFGCTVTLTLQVRQSKSNSQ
jgi:GTPase